MTAALFEQLDNATVGALSCPPWCIAEPGHGADEDDIKLGGGIYRHHRSREIVAVERPEFSHHAVTVRVEQLVSFDVADGLRIEAPVVAVRGAGGAEPGLTVEEAVALAKAITAAVSIGDAS